MTVEPRIRNGICMTAHPEGCAVAVQAEIDYVKAQPKFDGAKKVVVMPRKLTLYSLRTMTAVITKLGNDISFPVNGMSFGRIAARAKESKSVIQLSKMEKRSPMGMPKRRMIASGQKVCAAKQLKLF